MKPFIDKLVYLVDKNKREISKISLLDYLEKYVNKEIVTYQGINKQYSYEGNYEGNLWTVNKWAYSRLEDLNHFKNKKDAESYYFHILEDKYLDSQRGDYVTMFYNKENAEFYLQGLI